MSVLLLPAAIDVCDSIELRLERTIELTRVTTMKLTANHITDKLMRSYVFYVLSRHTVETYSPYTAVHT